MDTGGNYSEVAQLGVYHTVNMKDARSNRALGAKYIGSVLCDRRGKTRTMPS